MVTALVTEIDIQAGIPAAENNSGSKEKSLHGEKNTLNLEI